MTPFVSIVVFAMAMPGQATAQSSDTTEATTLAQAMSSAPKPGQSTATATVGGQIQDGRTETKSLGVTGALAHTTEKGKVLRFDVDTVYALYRPAADQPSFVAADNQLVSLTYLQAHGERVRLFGMAEWRRDYILDLDYRAWVEGGAGVVAFARGPASAFVGASYSAGREHRGDMKDGSFVMDVGVLQTFNVHLNKVLSFEQWFKGHKDTTDTGNDNYTLNVTFLTKVTKHAGMKISYNLQHDTLHPPTVSATQKQFNFGMQISFSSSAPAPAKP